MRGWLRGLAALALVVCGLAALVLARDPGLPTLPAPSAEDVEKTMAVLPRLRAASAGGGRGVTLTDREIDALLAVAGRLLPGPRAEIRLGEGAARLAVALPVAIAGRTLWAVLRAEVPDYAGAPRLTSVRLGAVPLPPGATLALLRAGAARLAGPASVERVLRLVDRVEVTRHRVTLVARPGDGSVAPGSSAGDLRPRALELLRGAPLPEGAEIAAEQRALETAIAEGRLAAEGSALPHLLFVLDRATAAAMAGADPDRAFCAAILALTRACGSEHIRPEIAGLVPGGAALDALPLGDSPCGSAGLHGRVDQRRHFVTAAALRALSARAPAVGMGEVKELSDMAFGAGFDLTDLVANQSGIRFAEAFLDAPPGGWDALRARIETEADVIAPLDGFPREKARADFEARFGGLDSPAYAAGFAEIEARIDALALHRR